MHKDLTELHRIDETFKQIKIIKQYASKKNTVAQIDFNHKLQVIKWFQPNSKKQFQIEQHQLKILSEHHLSPQIYDIDQQHLILFMEYFSGKNLCDLINDPLLSIAKKQQILYKLAQWFVSYHAIISKKKLNVIHGDAHLRNFILNSNVIGLDYEESRKGHIYEDIASLCASILTTDPLFTDEKIKLSHYFKNIYFDTILLKQESFQPFFQKAINNVISRRKDTKALKNAYDKAYDLEKLYFDNDSIK